MIKKTLVVIAGLALGLAFFVPANVSAASKKPAVKDYDYELVDQQPSGIITMQPGETKTVWIEVKNTGSKTWYSNGANPVRLGTGSQYGNANQQKDYNSELRDLEAILCPSCGTSGTWLDVNRPTAVSPSGIIPGWHARFQFTIKAPTTPGVYKAYFTPVADGETWMKDMGIYWEITVNSNNTDLNGGNTTGLNIGDDITITTPISNTNSFSYDSNILKYLWTGRHCDNPAPYTGGTPICNSVITQNDDYFEVIGDGFTRVEKGDFSEDIIAGRDYHFYDGSTTYPALYNAKQGDIVIVKLSNPGDGGYSFVNPEFPTGRVKLLDHTHFASTNSQVVGDFGSDQWAFEILDSNSSNYIQIRIQQPWNSGSSSVDFLLSINPALNCANNLVSGCVMQ